MGRLKGKKAFVTGSSSGIGRAVAERFAKEGADVAWHSHLPWESCPQLAGLTTPERFFQLDLAEAVRTPAVFGEFIDRVWQTLDGIDILVNNAGWYGEPHFLELTSETLARVIALNLTAPILLTQQWAALAIRKRPRPDLRLRGRAIFTTSINGSRGERRHTAYDASKGGLNAAIRGIGLDLADHGFTAVGISVGLADTPLTTADVNAAGVRRVLDKLIPLGVTTPDELAGTYVHYASDDAGPATAAIIPADGGIDGVQITVALDVLAALGIALPVS